MSLRYRLGVYVEMYARQLRDQNARAPLSLFQRMRRGHRIGTMAMLTIKGPSYRWPFWMRWRLWLKNAVGS